MRITTGLRLLTAGALALGLAACGPETSGPDEPAHDGASEAASDAASTGEETGSESDEAEAEDAGWPRTVTVGGADVTIEAPPEAIVAITAETADLALHLVDPERFAAVPESSQSPNSGTAVEEAQQVSATLPSSIDPDPEQILSYGPDLVISTGRHGGEKTAGEQLQATGVPVLNFDSEAFNSPEGIAEVLTVLGEALGEEETAAELTAALLEEMEAIDADRGEHAPTTLSLMARGPSVMAMDDTSMLPHLIQRAGGENAASTIGITETRPIDAELIGVANPEIIFVEDFRGLGLEPFEEMLSNPALAEVPAIANDEIHLISMTAASTLSGLQTPTGYREIVDIVNAAG